MANRPDKIAQQRQRIMDNLCRYCGAPPAPGRTSCRPCLDYHNANSKKVKLKATAERRCIRCGQPAYQRYKTCQECRRKDLVRRSEAHQERGMCFSCGRRPHKPNCRNCQKCIDRTSKNSRRHARENRQKVLDHYGRRCTCCGEENQYFLTLDHINGDGAAHRKEIKRRGAQVYSWVIKNNFPDGFQILCWNCNCGKSTYGSCPHTWKTGHPPEDSKYLTGN